MSKAGIKRAAKQTSTPLRLRIAAAGICCAVGASHAAACCALRANVDHFQESEFRDAQGEPLRVARLPDTEHWGAGRLARWIRIAIADCLRNAPQVDLAATPLVLLTLEPERPHGEEHEQLATAAEVARLLGIPLHPSSRVIAGGRPGLAMALSQIAAMAKANVAQRFLLVGADTLLNAASVGHYLAEERLLATGNSDGFLPGEAAAAVLLEVGGRAAGVYVTGVGRGSEAGRPDGSVPSRAMGLSAAMRAAIAQAGVPAGAIAFRVSDQNGESFFAGEAADAMTRLGTDGVDTQAVLTTADCAGEIGAATGPLMLALLADLMPRGDGPGRCGLIHLAGDGDERCAVVVEHRT